MYLDLIKERNRLISRIKSFEKDEIYGKPSFSFDIIMNPSTDVQYQCHLGYLAHLCDFMREKYCCEYVWGERKLSEGVKRQFSSEKIGLCGLSNLEEVKCTSSFLKKSDERVR